MKNYYKVSFEYSEGIYCTNMAHAETAADVEKHYSEYTWCSVREAAPYELDEAKTKGMPIIEIEHEEPATTDDAKAEKAKRKAAQMLQNGDCSDDEYENMIAWINDGMKEEKKEAAETEKAIANLEMKSRMKYREGDTCAAEYYREQAEEFKNGPEKAEGKKEEKTMENYTITKNQDYNSLEIVFPGKPSEAVRDALKALKFRWHGVRRVWYGYTTEEAARAAIDGADGKESTRDAQTVKASSSAVTKPDQDHIRIYYNGIKMDGGKLIRCYYSLDNNADHAQSVSIGAMDYQDLPRDLLPVTNNSDSYTDYFEHDHAYITPDHPLYKYLRFVALKDRARDAEKRIKTLEESLNGAERWHGQREAYRREIAQCKAHIEEYKAAVDPGQPTAADLEAINRQRQEQENALREARHAEELAERERVLNARNDGRRFIEATAKEYPIEEGAPVVTIEWSENPAFYDWNDTDTLKLSVAAAELILSSLDNDVTRQARGYDKTSFRINWKDENGEEMTYSGRYDLGDNEGGLIAHIRSMGEWECTHEQFGKVKAIPDETNDRLQVAEYLQQFTA